MKEGIMRIQEERHRQIDAEGYGAEHDDDHNEGELAKAAALYALPPRLRDAHGLNEINMVGMLWPWALVDFKPGIGIEGRIRELEKAGALIAAEIDRIQRMRVGDAI